MSALRRVVIAHAYTADPDKHWYPWLRKQLEPHGIDLVIPALPESSAPKLSDWVNALGETLGAPDESTVLVGHSLGCVTCLRALAPLQGEWKLAGLVLVAGFHEPLSSRPELDPFTADALDVSAVVARVPTRVCILSDNDSVVAPVHSRSLAEFTQAEQVVVPGGGHFLEREGCFELPALLEVLEAVAGVKLGAE
eukprot:TRINITY_DN11723_c0_g1_i1.p1 TRINITY_DN11723_c0_g1~~TRINITY_DN11723_c0_g1_i1.p1  ORF type:complete len:195 (-),score=35.63 TRINITY_DN11723_c0_g1_i1:134-718(-)